MEINILEENQNPLFNRKEVIIEVEAEITPSHSDAEKVVSEQFKTSPESFKIKKIEGKFGSKVFKISANIYPSKEEKEDTEFKTKQEKEAEIKALEAEAKEPSNEEPKEKVEEAPAETEKTKEEKIEEVKEEVKEEPKEEKTE